MNIDFKEAARRSGCSPDHMRKLMKAGKAPGTKIGRSWIVPEEIFQEWLGTRQVSADYSGPSHPMDRALAECPRHIYIFRAGDHIKIGISENPEQRWLQIATSNPLLDIEQRFITANKHYDALFIERRMHTELAHYRVSSPHSKEWFKCEARIAIELLERVIATLCS
jgi:excisionase family DNA binding protein